MTDYLPDVLPEYSRDFSNELSIDIFLKYGFYKICDAGLKPEYRFRDNPEVGTVGIYKKYTRLTFVCYLREKIAMCPDKNTLNEHELAHLTKSGHSKINIK